MDEDVVVCTKCGTAKPKTAFPTDRRRRSGVRPWCRVCANRHQTEWRARPENQPDTAARRRAKRLAVKLETLRHYGGVCACCGEADTRFLTFDHVDGDGKAHRASSSLARSRIGHWLRNNGYPEGFQVLCFNCNSGRAINGGVCPHQDPQGRAECAS